MSKVIIITGQLATGKSTLANNLSKAINTPCFQKDFFKEKFCDEIGFTTREENKKLSQMAIEELIKICDEYCSNNFNVILEANFSAESMEKIKQIADKNNCKVSCICLIGDPNVLYERYVARIPSRHRVHSSVNFHESVEALKAYNDTLLNQKICFNVNYIDITNLSVEQVLAEAIEIIEK